jgi:hypothetical protein
VYWRASPTGSSPGRDNSDNLPPNVWAGVNRTLSVNSATTISGALSDDRWPGTTLTSWWAQISGPAEASFGNNTLTSIVVTFSQTGQYVLRFGASDSAFTNTHNTIIDVVRPPFDTWRNTHFTTPELADVSISGPAADPDGDGLNNAQEYFFAMLPKVPNQEKPIGVELVSGHIETTWLQRVDALDIVGIIERADRIEGPWFGGAGLFERMEMSADDPYVRRVKIRSLLPTAVGSQQFVRIQLRLIE